MATTERRVTLNLDLQADRQKLREIGSMVDDTVGKSFSSEKINEYFRNMKSAATDAFKVIGDSFNKLDKPLITKNAAKETAANIEAAYKGLDQKLVSSIANLTKSFASISNQDALQKIKEISKAIEQMTSDYEKVGQLFSEARSMGTQNDLKKVITEANKELTTLNKKSEELSKTEIKRQTELKQVIEDTNKKLEERQKLREEGRAILQTYGVDSRGALENKINDAKSERKDLINGSISLQDFQSLKKLIEEIRDAIKGVNTETAVTVDNINKVWDAGDEANREMEQQQRTFKTIMKDLGLPLLTLNELASTMRRVIKISYNYVKQLDGALTEIAIVSGKTRSEVLGLTDTFIELSAKTGMAIDDIAKASTIFYQQGLDDAAVKKLTEYTALFAKISSETVEKAADQITAAINGFGWSVDQAGDVIDKLSVLAAKSAADIDELATAMSKAAAQANMAGLSFDQYNAYLATMIEATREAPENIGTSLKTIMSRFQQVKDDVADDGTDINAVEKALRSVGVALRDEEGQLRDLGDVLEELGPKWNSLSRNTQAYLGTIIAGTRQQSRFVTLMQHWDRALELTAESQNSAGAAARMHASAMEGMAASLNNLTNAWQRLISSIVNGDDFKAIIDAVTSFVKWLGDGHAVLKIFTGLMVIFNAKTLLTNATLLAQNKRINNLNVAFHDLYKMVDRTKSAMAALNAPLETATADMIKQADVITDLTNKYNNLAVAKSRANGTPVVETNTPTGGIKNIPSQYAYSDGKLFSDQSKNVFPTKLGNITSLIGSIQTGLMVSSLATSLATWISSKLFPTANDLKNKAQEEFDKVQEKIDKIKLNIDTIEQVGATYDKLSKKINKSADEVKELAEAAQALAKAAPNAVIGYDSNGNPIISTILANQRSTQYQEDLKEQAAIQIGNLGQLSNASLREEAEAELSKGVKTTSSILKVVSTIAGTVMTIAGAVAIATGVGIPVGAGLIAGGALIAGGGWIGADAIKAQAVNKIEAKKAANEAKKIIEQYRNDILENLQIITDSYLSAILNSKVNKEEVSKIYNFIQTAWTDKYIKNLFADNIEYDKKGNIKSFNTKAFEKGMAVLPELWAEDLANIDVNKLNSAIELFDKKLKNIKTMTYSQVESVINEVLDELKIDKEANAELYETLKTAFFNAAYEGISSGINLVIDDLKTRRDEALNDEVKALYQEAIDLVSDKLTSEQAGFYNNIGLFDDVNIFLQTVKGVGDQVNAVLQESSEAAKLVIIDFLETSKRELEKKLKETQDLTEEEREAIEKEVKKLSQSISKIWNSMASSAATTFAQLFDELEKISDKTQAFWSTYNKIMKGEGLGYSDAKNFFSMIDDVDLSMFSNEQLIEFSGALDQIAAGMKVVNGQLYLSANGVEKVASLEQMLVEAKIKTMAQELLNTKSYLEAQNAVIDAEIASIDTYLSGDADKTEADQKWAQAQLSLSKAYFLSEKALTSDIDALYGEMYASILTKYDKFITAMSRGQITPQDMQDVRTFWGDVKENFNYDSFYENVLKGKSDEEIRNMRNALVKRKNMNNVEISRINGELAILQSGLLWTQNGTAGDTAKIEQYIGKLKEVYNILNRIQSISTRLDLLDKYQEIARGDNYVNVFKDRLDFNEELMDQYAFLIPELQAFTNGYRDFIQSVDGLEGVFDFDEFGQIIINWDKYNALQSETIEGQVSMKEKADDVYDTYMEMWTDVGDKAKEYCDVLKKVVDLYQKVIDTYIDVEHKAADAVKEIYQEILDARLDAIDKEKEALEELRDARSKANKEMNDAKEVQGIQSDIQRAMMDTSGASASALIKAQSNLNDKISSMAEDKYEEQLDDIMKRLDDEKEALQQEFDDMFYDMTWLFEELERGLMMDEGGLGSIYAQTQEWREKTPLERQMALDQLHQDFMLYWSQLNGDKGITDIYNQMVYAAGRIIEIDDALKTEVSKIPAEVAQTLGKWQSQIQSQIDATNNRINSIGSGLSFTSITPTTWDPGNTDLKDVDYKVGPNDKKGGAFKVGDKVKSKEQLSDGGLNWVRTYKGIENDTVKNAMPISGWPSEYSQWKDGDDETTIVDAKKVDGTWYYLLKGLADQKRWFSGHQLSYLHGGLADYTGLAWLDGTKTQPEAVLNALQTKHFIDFTNTLDKMYGQGAGMSAAVNIDTISFNVESMSSVEDGEKAFTAFVNKFNEVGSQSGIRFNNFQNTH